MQLTFSEKLFNIVFNYIVMVLFLFLLPLLLILIKDVRKMWQERFILEAVQEKMNE